jgi:hypothetical protein
MGQVVQVAIVVLFPGQGGGGGGWQVFWPYPTDEEMACMLLSITLMKKEKNSENINPSLKHAV